MKVVVAAISQLNAFINEVGTLMLSGRLDTASGQALIDSALETIESISRW